MKDYKNYHRIDNRSKFVHDGSVLFDIMLRESMEKQTVTINEVEHDVIIQTKSGDTHSDKRYVLSKPNIAERGTYIYSGDDIWLVTSLLSHNDVNDKLLIQLCNTTISYDNGEKIPIEWDRFANPKKWSDAESLIVNCVSDKTVAYGDGKYSDAINLPDNKIKVTIPYTEHKIEEFTIYGEKYRVRDIDMTKTYKGKGIISITGERKVDNNE